MVQYIGMKAKEYFQEYQTDTRPSNEKLTDIAVKFIQEIQTTGKTRHIQTDAAFVSIVKEQEQKWKAFARMTAEGKDGRLDGSFMTSLKTLMPGMWEHFRSYELRQKLLQRIR